ncbi:MAG TPA: 3-oxoacyl-ACP reductase [Gammaproteobacteria bacterium]|jgi:3-oxoacyl-[acyl-carrier protein] reductase|nr:3-oxoacyl-ACP reductase FabG [Litorivicinus sp.]MBT6288092.1 3-oxoacyl-ACP reductase FabG [Oceanospirillales bacterium]MDA0894513.1 3-oxoacyl-ACP reductase FabG [Pseudomonadota bacterium]MDA8705642.1 3-oxoacyl-ACP reductase FabG [Litorivicinaceae bacterium]HAY55428.1 3-oxoacyl-ACP reductase [Gammaproteobacteria bacterium]|tara:strand:+ start:465 stop:1187 length:723 start_codon:yes stop_codon:yes gene_type:complete
MTVALVTGASRGIGQAISERLVKQGFYVIGTATSEAGAQAISERLGSAGEGRVLNVTDPAMVSDLAKSLAESDQSPLVLVNNAGITKDTLMLRMKPEDWQSVIDTNLTSIFTVVSAFIKPMTKARTGRIINISSVVGSMGNAGQVNYAAAKAGLEGMTRAMAREFGSRAITVNAVAPGFIETDMTHVLPEAQKEALLSQVPLGRLGSAEEVAGTVAFLASEEASYVTGTTLHVNGGMYMA